MDDVFEFGRIVLVVSGGLLLAIGVRVVAGRLAVPTRASCSSPPRSRPT